MDRGFAYPISLLPFRVRALDADRYLAVSDSGDHAYLNEADLATLSKRPDQLPLHRLAELKSKYFLGDPSARGALRLLASRISTKQETILSGPSLHIIVPTLQCAHSCRYCQVSRALDATGYTISPVDLYAACDTIFQSPAKNLTVEFQGGDPLLRFDLVRAAIERVAATNAVEKRNVRFVVASTLHQLDETMCAFFKAHQVYLSTSIDGPPELHNQNRALPTRDGYERTVAGIGMARSLISWGAVSALMTTTRASLECPEQIVDEYVALGFNEIFLRPLSRYGFAKRNERVLGYSLAEFHKFYERGLERVLYWNKRGVSIRETAASIALNKILSPFDAGYVDLQSPAGAGVAVLVYNYDGYVYPSDEARMLAEAGDTSLRLGHIGDSLEVLRDSEVQRDLIVSSQSRTHSGCKDCAYNAFCGPNPVDAYNQFGSFTPSVHLTDHCQHQMWLFDHLFQRLHRADAWFEDLAHRWAEPVAAGVPGA